MLKRWLTSWCCGIVNQMIGVFVWSAPIWSGVGVVTIGKLRVLGSVRGARHWLLSWFCNFSVVMDSMNRGCQLDLDSLYVFYGWIRSAGVS